MTGEATEVPARDGAAEHPPGLYFRGAAPSLSRPVIARIALGALVAVLTAISLAILTDAIASQRRNTELAENGITVSATVTNCYGMASGTGITAAGYRCTARFALNGRTDIEPIRKSRTLYQPGQVVAALVDPHDPSTLTLAQASHVHSAPWAAYALAAGPTALALVVIALAMQRRRSRRTRHRPSTTCGPPRIRRAVRSSPSPARTAQ